METTNWNPAALLELSGSYWETCALHAGVKLELFTPLGQPSRSAYATDRRPDKMSAAELRQARALYRSQQRIQRLEMYQWMGYEPLRPNWPTVPSMTSRYQNRIIYVPVYYYGR